MRRFIRHPATVPIEVSPGSTPEPSRHEAMNVSLGGLAFHAGQKLESSIYGGLRRDSSRGADPRARWVPGPGWRASPAG